MALPTQPYKGARDFYPEDKRLQKYVFSKMRQVVERFGYEEYDAPIIEPLELYLAKTGEEIVNEQTYTFEDRGGRKVALRPEMTPTVSRMVAARRQELGYPLRWYSLPNLWRYERPQKGRLREHWQLNVDLFGVDNIAAEFEIIEVIDTLMKQFGANQKMYKIRLNDRRFMDYVLLEHFGLDAVQSQSIAKLIDRIHKMERAEFLVKLDLLFTPKQRETGFAEKLLTVLSAQNISDLPDGLADHASLEDLKMLMSRLEQAGIANAVFDASLMRGFDYYNGVVFEVFDTNPENARSLFGGGRYDGLVGLFGVEPVPTVGFGMGDVVLVDFLNTHNLMPNLAIETQVYVALAGNVLDDAQAVVQELRGAGVNVAVDTSGKALDKQLRTADKKGVPYVMVIGATELQNKQYKLKNMKTGTEEAHSVERIVSIVHDARQRNQ